MSVDLRPYDPTWQRLFLSERLRLQRLMPSALIEHIGSTAIPNMPAKPVIDIIIGVPASSSFSDFATTLHSNGYVQEGARQGHAWFCSPSPDHRKFIVHLTPVDGSEWHNRRAFRDYLLAHPEIARAYAQMKKKLAAAHADDLDAYTGGKSEFVYRIVRAACH